MTAVINSPQAAEALARQRREEIRNAPDGLRIAGTVYYAAADGCDENDGKTPATPWRTLEKVSAAPLAPGDGVLFRRGDLFRGSVQARPGVTYGAYGTGEKPRLYGWCEDLADPALWECTDAAHCIWRYVRRIPDVGVLVFDGGVRHSYKLIPSFIGGRFVCRDESRPFVMAAEMKRDLDIYWHYADSFTTVPSKGQDFPVPDVVNTRGELYLRCDAGNPGAVFASIEAAPRACMFCVGGTENVHIDNLCLKYIGIHAVSAGGPCVKGLCVTNCEIGWVGGCIQHYYGTDPNYPQGGRGTVTRYGNGVEIYGGCDGYTVTDCYIYQIYDAGITNQNQENISDASRSMHNVAFTNNLIEYCEMSIEYYLGAQYKPTEGYMRNVLYEGNIMRFAGMGWGSQRGSSWGAHLKSWWMHYNQAYNFIIRNNIFDRSRANLINVVADKAEWLPKMEGNTYVHYLDAEGGRIGQPWGDYPFNKDFPAAVEKALGERDIQITYIQK